MMMLWRTMLIRVMFLIFGDHDVPSMNEMASAR